MTSTIIISVLSVIGLVFVIIPTLLKVIEAIYFGGVYAFMHIKWSTVRWKHIGWILRFAFRSAWSRLFGGLAFYDRVRAGGWEYKTPFIIYRITQETNHEQEPST